MRGVAGGLFLGLCILLTGAPGYLSAQTREGTCANPPPSPVAHRSSLFPVQLFQDIPPASGKMGCPTSVDGRLPGWLRPNDEAASQRQSVEVRAPEPGKAFLLSALVPGAGQKLLGQGRWTPYAAAEVWAWSQFMERRNEGRDLQRRYRDLAWLVARRVSAGTRTDAGWEYYEALSRFHSSGAFDMDPQSPGVQPEQNPDTFNGTIWDLARDLFLPEDPAVPLNEESEPFKKALQYYVSRAYRPALAWNWGGNLLHREEYARLIRESDENLRRSTTMIGVILANHLLSAVDALVSARLGLLGEDQTHMEILLSPAPFDTYEMAFRVSLPTSILHER